MLGWYVGFVENEQGVYFFALNIEGSQFSEIMKKRISIAKGHLTKLGILK